MFCRTIFNVVPVSSRAFSTTHRQAADYTHIIIGAGVVGLATARQLAQRPDTRTLLLERHPVIGTETSSRNSGVIHAGLYYPPASLKTSLCIRGKQLLYALCATHHIPFAQLGKWIVAQTPAQREALKRLQVHAEALGVPTRWVGGEESRRLEPEVRAAAGVLESPSTGIVDVHSLMQVLLGEFESAGGDVALNAATEGLENKEGGFVITVRDRGSGEVSEVTAETVVNAAGLGAVAVSNMLLPKERHVVAHFAKGNYFSYAGAVGVKRLVYPVPEPGLAGLGTHLTLDLAGMGRFGPDVEWVDDPQELAVNESRLPEAVEEIRKYLPGVQVERLVPDYAGMRPKLSRGGSISVGGKDGGGFQDFVIRTEDGYEGFVNLLGIESPGLTSSLAIAEVVEEILYK